jgi:hypothetical protein
MSVTEGSLRRQRLARRKKVKWPDVRIQFPHQWLVVEALDARSELGKRHLEELAIVDQCPDGESAMRTYLDLHRQAPERELYVLHTDREKLEIAEQNRLGIRAAG